MFSEPQNLFLVVLVCFVLNRLDCFQRINDSTRLAELKIIRERRFQRTGRFGSIEDLEGRENMLWRWGLRKRKS